MENAIKHLVKGFDMLSSVELRLKGEDIDKIGIARQELRTAYSILVDLKNKKDSEVSDNG